MTHAKIIQMTAAKSALRGAGQMAARERKQFQQRIATLEALLSTVHATLGRQHSNRCFQFDADRLRCLIREVLQNGGTHVE